MRSIDDFLRERSKSEFVVRWAKRNNTDVRKNDRGGRALDEEERAKRNGRKAGK